MLSFEDARQKLLGLARAVGDERVSVEQAAGRVLREKLVSATDHPPWAQSTMDGYAVRSADCVQSTPIRLPLATGESRAGGPKPGALDAGHALRIFTGAPMPPNADAVVIQEVVKLEGGAIVFSAAPAKGRFVRPRGQDLQAGDVALEPGTRLGPAQCALAASLDKAWLRVAARPVVTILATGDELRDGTVGLSVPLPVLYQQQGQVGQAEAATRLAEVALAKLEAQVTAEVAVAWSAMVAARSAAQRGEQRLLERSRTARDLVRLQYTKGAASLLEYLDAQRVDLNNQIDYLFSLAAYWTAVFQLEQAVGKTFLP